MSEPEITYTEWAVEILGRAQQAARRFDPDAKLRLARAPTGVEAALVHEPAPDDKAFDAGEATVFVEAGLQGLVDVEEPHDRPVLPPPGPTPDLRPHHRGPLLTPAP